MGSAALPWLAPHAYGLYREKVVGYIVTALGIDGPSLMHLYRVHLAFLPIVFGSHRGLVANTNLFDIAVAESHLGCRRMAHHRRCQNLTVAGGPGPHSVPVAELHIGQEVCGHIYDGRFGGKTFLISLIFGVRGVS